MGTPTGCKIYRLVKRRSKADAADPIFFNSVCGTPWCPAPDDASERMALAAAVQEELDFMRPLKAYPEVPADLVLKAGEAEEFEAYRLLLRRYECVMASKANVLKVAIVHDCQAKAERLWMTKNLTETILKDLNSITKYNTKQLVDNMNKNKVLKQILIKEKVDVKANLQRPINALDAQFNDLQLNRRKNWEQSEKKRTLLEKKFTP